MTPGEARELAARLRDLDIEDAEGGLALRELERQLSALAEGEDAWEALSAAMIEACTALETAQGARAIERMRLAEASRGIVRSEGRATRLQQDLDAVREQIEALRADLRAQGEQLATLRAQAMLTESALRQEVAARDALLAQERARSASLEGTVFRLEGTLAEAGHRLVTRVGQIAARHPMIAATLRMPVWLASRLRHTKKP